MKYCLLLSLFVVAACASKTTAPVVDNTEETQPDFNRGMKALEREDFGGAADVFDRLLVAKPATENDLVISYNSGVAHEGMGQCSKAAERYREVARSSAGKYARLEAQAFFRLSLAYECLGRDTKTVTALLDTKKRSKELTIEIARAELPARLAAAYSRLGNRAKALEYFRQASDGLKTIVAEGTATKKQKEVLGRTLYYMGRLNPAQRNAEGNPNAFLLSLSMQQPYLLQTVELAPQPWSGKADADLTAAYDNFMRFKLANPDQQHAFYVRALQVINEIRKIRMPDGGPQEDAIFAQVDKTERQVQARLAEVGPTTRLTPEAEKREGDRREGRLVDPKAVPPKRIK